MPEPKTMSKKETRRDDSATRKIVKASKLLAKLHRTRSEGQDPVSADVYLKASVLLDVLGHILETGANVRLGASAEAFDKAYDVHWGQPLERNT